MPSHNQLENWRNNWMPIVSSPLVVFPTVAHTVPPDSFRHESDDGSPDHSSDAEDGDDPRPNEDDFILAHPAQTEDGRIGR